MYIKGLTARKWRLVLFVLVIFELIIGGGGRIFTLGSITLRMILFIFMLLLSIRELLKSGVNRLIATNVIIWLSLVLLFVLVGLVNGASIGLIFTDLKPISYFLVLPFFYTVLKDEKDVSDIIVRALKFGGLGMALAFVFFFLLVFFGYVDIKQVYIKLANSSEFFFKGDYSFYYKGFVFLPIVFSIYFSEKKYIISIVVMAAIILSQTRALYILTVMGLWIFNQNKLRNFIILSSLGLLVLLFFGDNVALIFTNHQSDSYRWAQITEVWRSMDVLSLFIGNGFGVGTMSRPVHMEIAYLEIIHKLGVFGLFYYLILALIVVINTVTGSHRNVRIIGSAGVLIFIQSFFNSYILNPIGVGFIIINLCYYIIRVTRYD